ncbi:autotransporter outer membrane beta-barrel domain-containing protein [Dialister invisus]|uniref:autotransporter outer membrane beta-barrel domain-containing protein n=1 Tax=Dialister invisus TaxID=218538 RepID=UPI003520A57F
MNRNSRRWKWLNQSILAGLVACSYAGVVQAEEYAAPITGVAEQDTLYKDKGILDEDGEYIFEEDGEIKVGSANASNKIVGAIRSDGKVTVTAEKALILSAKSGKADETVAGIYAFKPVNVTNTSGTTSIRTEGAGDVYGIYAAGGNKATRPEGGKVSFTGNLDISVTGKNAYGLYVANSEDDKSVKSGNITIDGALTMKIAGTKATGIYVGDCSGWSPAPSVKVNGKFTLQTDKNVTALDTVTTRKGMSKGKITLSDADIKTGGLIGDMVGEIAIRNGKLESTGGTAFKMRAEAFAGNLVLGSTGGGEIHLKGDIERNVRTEIFEDKPYEVRSGYVRIYLGPNSTWEGKFTGADISNSSDIFCNAGLWKNTGSATISRYFTDETFDKYKFATVYQTKESGKLIFKDWRGMMNGLFIYDHDAADPTKILGGDIEFKVPTGFMSQQPPADWIRKVIFRTDSTGLRVNSEAPEDKALVLKTLNALANKFWLADYTTYSKLSIDPYVEIAEGLTSSSARLAGGKMLFKINGQGVYTDKIQTKTEFTTTLTGAVGKDEEGNTEGDVEYVESGVYRPDEMYTFSKSSRIRVSDGAGIGLEAPAILNVEKDLEIISEGDEGAVGIDTAGKELRINPISSEGKTGAVRKITVRAKSKDGMAQGLNIVKYAEGIYTFAKDGRIQWDIHAEGADSPEKAENDEYSIGMNISGGTSFTAQHADITSTGKIMELRGKSSSASTDVRITSGTLKTSMLDKAVYLKEYSNLHLGDSWNVLNLEGNIYGEERSSVYYLMSVNARWKGAAESEGDMTLNMMEGAYWENTGKSHIRNITTSESYTNPTSDRRARIYQAKGSGTIFIENLETPTGVGTVAPIFYYDHDPTNPTHMFGGDIIIEKVPDSAEIVLRTDNAGLKVDSKRPEDINLVNETLNALANKLYYLNYPKANGGERNLTGSLEIAEGLTSQSALKTAEMSFNEINGQGQYRFIPEIQNVNPIKATLDGSDIAEAVYENAGVYKKEKNRYIFTEDPALVQAAAAVKGSIKDLDISTKGTLMLLGNKDNGTGIAAENGKKVVIRGKTYITGRRGIHANNGTVVLYGDSRIDTGEIKVENGGKLHMAGNLDVDTLSVNGENAKALLLADKEGTPAITAKVNTIIVTNKALLNASKGAKVEIGLFSVKNATANFNDTVTIGNGLKAENGARIMMRRGGEISGTVTVKGEKTLAFLDGVTVRKGSVIEALSKGQININGGKTEKNRVKADGGIVKLRQGSYRLGDIEAKKGGRIYLNSGNKTEIEGTVTVDKPSTAVLQMKGSSSVLKGNITGEGTAQLEIGRNGKWEGTMKTGSSKVKLGDKSVWTPTENTDIGYLNGNKATVDMSKANKKWMKISNYSGDATFYLDHSATEKENQGLKIKSGGIAVRRAEKGSRITLRIDNKGLRTNSTSGKDKALVEGTLDNLAGKLSYVAYATGQRNLKGRVEIAEGLTSPSAALSGDITFTKTGKGSYRPVKGGGEKRSAPLQKTAYFLPAGTTSHTVAKPTTSPIVEPAKAEPVTATKTAETAAKASTAPRMRRTSEIIYGDKETQMMRGSKTAMTAAALLWRGNNNDLERRMGDIRLGKEENGIWARYLGGKNELDKQKTSYKQTYNIAQAGYDKKKGNWTIGMALDYGTGKDTYASGTGKEKLASLSLYGTMQKEDGQYLDIILKGSRIKNDYSVYNEMNHRLDGKYRTSGLSVSVEYGKRSVRENGFYIEPSLELTAGHLSGEDYDAISDYAGGKKMHIRQEGVNSVIGRIGLGIGKETERTSLFAKIGLSHEFGGKVKSTFSAEGEPTSGTEVELKDSWVDVEVGGSFLVNRNTYLYGTYTRNFGADLSNKWRIDAGIRFSF